MEFEIGYDSDVEKAKKILTDIYMENDYDNTSMAIYEKLSSYLYLPIDMLYRIFKGENIMKEIKTDDMAMKAEIYTELINDMQARIYEYSKETGGHLSKEITDLNKQLSYAHTESRIYVDEEHFKKWDALILSAKAAIIKDKMFVYDKTYQSSILIDCKYINIVRDFRNACAHSNCLINQLAKELPGEPDSRITTFVSGMKGISKAVRVKYLHRSFTYNFTTLLFVYDYYVPESAKKKRYQELQGFLNGRVVTHKEYFKTNAMLCGTYNFVKKLIDNLCI